MRARSLVLALLLVAACARGPDGNGVSGGITPDYFKFVELVPYSPTDPDGNGWRAVCIVAAMQAAPPHHQKAHCDFEVGVPIRLDTGEYITVRKAQAAAAMAANAAAYRVLSRLHVELMLGPACIEFRRLMEEILRNSIIGARVRKCTETRLEPVLFDPVAP
jgi:hypothetical protein